VVRGQDYRVRVLPHADAVLEPFTAGLI
jgi:hypothetical protein